MLGRRSRTRSPAYDLERPALAAAALLGVGLTAYFGVIYRATGIGSHGRTDDPLTAQLTAEARAVSDPQSLILYTSRRPLRWPSTCQEPRRDISGPRAVVLRAN